MKGQRQLLSQHLKTTVQGTYPNAAGGGYGVLVVPGGAADVIPGGFPIKLRLWFGDYLEELQLEAPRAFYFPEPFTRVELAEVDPESGYTLHVATAPGVVIGPSRSTRRGVNVYPAGTEVSSASPETMTDGINTNGGMGMLIGRFEGEADGEATEYIRYADGSWEVTGNTYGAGDTFEIPVTHPNASYYWKHTAGGDLTYLVDAVVEVG